MPVNSIGFRSGMRAGPATGSAYTDGPATCGGQHAICRSRVHKHPAFSCKRAHQNRDNAPDTSSAICVVVSHCRTTTWSISRRIADMSADCSFQVVESQCRSGDLVLANHTAVAATPNLPPEPGGISCLSICVSCDTIFLDMRPDFGKVMY